jgi:hypothetical protein
MPTPPNDSANGPRFALESERLKEQRSVSPKILVVHETFCKRSAAAFGDAAQPTVHQRSVGVEWGSLSLDENRRSSSPDFQEPAVWVRGRGERPQENTYGNRAHRKREFLGSSPARGLGSRYQWPTVTAESSLRAEFSEALRSRTQEPSCSAAAFLGFSAP